MKYPDSLTRKLYSKTKSIKHDRIQNNFIHASGPLKGAWHIEPIQEAYSQIAPKKK